MYFSKTTSMLSLFTIIFSLMISGCGEDMITDSSENTVPSHLMDEGLALNTKAAFGSMCLCDLIGLTLGPNMHLLDTCGFRNSVCGGSCEVHKENSDGTETIIGMGECVTVPFPAPQSVNDNLEN